MEKLVETLRTLLARNIVRFTYRKVDGTLRHAIGTRNLDLARNYALANPSIQYCDIPTPRGEEKPYSYFDLDKMEWRGYCPQNLISIEGVVEISTRYAKENPISKTEGKGGFAFPIGFGGAMGGFGGGVPKEEIRKAIDKLDKDIVIGAPAHSPKVGKPTDVGYGMALPLDGVGGGAEMTIDDFAKLVARYVVDLLAHRLTEN